MGDPVARRGWHGARTGSRHRETLPNAVISLSRDCERLLRIWMMGVGDGVAMTLSWRRGGVVVVRKRKGRTEAERNRFGASGWAMSPAVFEALERLAKRRTSTKSAIICEVVISFLTREGKLPDGLNA